MNVGILGTGIVGQTIGTRLVELGHNVKLGSRSAVNEKARAWAKRAGRLASQGTFADTAKFGEVLFNCVSGMGTLSALDFAGVAYLNNKVLIDVANPLDYTRGSPPTLTVSNTDSLAEQIQRIHPLVRVVKALNTMNVDVMVYPERVHGPHDVFICGNDKDAKATVTMILMEWFRWDSVIDLGDITNARGMEMALPLWLSLQKKLGTNIFNFHVAR
ncbi:MAG: NAD(P)-binding domain-containing protein [Chloroflexi bacterium]|nr:NAD(P)-binding domain-containing protein [Chloroflexota bacterium]